LRIPTEPQITEIGGNAQRRRGNPAIFLNPQIQRRSSRGVKPTSLAGVYLMPHLPMGPAWRKCARLRVYEEAIVLFDI
jgi:hypothetical protein